MAANRISSIGRKLLKDLEENIYCRVGPSKVHGVGVVAIRNIPKGKQLFKTFLKYQLTPVPWEMIKKNSKIDPAVKQLAYDMYPLIDGNLNLYRAGLNAVDVGFFINHSEHPNVTTKKDSDAFFAMRAIKKGEELFVNYHTYTEL
jgi:SET domain-containing protein